MIQQLEILVLASDNIDMCNDSLLSGAGQVSNIAQHKAATCYRAKHKICHKPGFRFSKGS
jgi:hypothetical protein